MVAQYAEKRTALKAAGDYAGLDALPKNSSKVRLKNRCQMTGRPRGYSRHFGISRIALRDMALNGMIPGLKKWVCRSRILKNNIKILNSKV